MFKHCYLRLRSGYDLIVQLIEQSQLCTKRSNFYCSCMISLFSLHMTAQLGWHWQERLQSIRLSDQPRPSTSSAVVSENKKNRNKWKRPISRDLPITIAFRKQLEPLYLHSYVKLASHIIFSYRYSFICEDVYEHLFLCYRLPLKEFIE